MNLPLVFFKEMPLLQKEPMESESKAATTYLLYHWLLWIFHEEYYNQFRWSEIGIWILKYRCPGKGSQLSPQMSIEIYISSLKVKVPGHCHSWWYLRQHIFIHLNTCHWWIESQPESIIISLQGKFRNFCTYRDIGNIDVIWTQRTLFSKIREQFGVIMLLSQKVVLRYSKLVRTNKCCSLFFKATWRLLLTIAPYCRKQQGLSASCCWLWKAPRTASLL